MTSLRSTGERVRVSKRIGQKHHYLFATQVTHMDRVSTRGNLYRMRPFLGLERVAPNIPANILLLNERKPTGLGDSHGSVS